VEEYEARIQMPYERGLYIAIEGPPKPIKTEKYELELTRARSPAWKPKDGTDLFASPILADQLVIQFLELADKVTAERNRRKSPGWL
jgi:hypothetical protein